MNFIGTPMIALMAGLGVFYIYRMSQREHITKLQKKGTTLREGAKVSGDKATSGSLSMGEKPMPISPFAKINPLAAPLTYTPYKKPYALRPPNNSYRIMKERRWLQGNTPHLRSALARNSGASLKYAGSTPLTVSRMFMKNAISQIRLRNKKWTFRQ